MARFVSCSSDYDFSFAWNIRIFANRGFAKPDEQRFPRTTQFLRELRGWNSPEDWYWLETSKVFDHQRKHATPVEHERKAHVRAGSPVRATIVNRIKKLAAAEIDAENPL